MSDENKKINVVVDAEVKGKDKIDGLKKSITEVAEAGSGLPAMFGEANEGILGFAEGIGKAIKAAKAFMATGLGLVLAGIALAVVSVKEAFESSEEGQNKMAKMFGILSAIGEKLKDILVSVGEAIIYAFEKPGEAIKKFGTLLKTYVTNIISGQLELIPALGSAVMKLFKGDFAGAGKIAADALTKATTGIDHVTDRIENASKAINKWGKDVAEAGKIAGQVADKRAKADKLERNLIIQKSVTEAKIAEAREIASDKEGYSAIERKKALVEAQKLEEELYTKEKQVYGLRAEAQDQEMQIVDATKENLQKQVEARKAVIDLDTKKAVNDKKLRKAEQAANKEMAAEAKKIADERKKAQEDAAKTGLEQLKKLEENKVLTTKEGSQERLDAEAEALDAELEYSKKNAKLLGLTSTDLTNLELKNAEASYNAQVAFDDKVAALKQKSADDAEKAEMAEIKREDKQNKKNLAKILKNNKIILKDKISSIKKSEEAQKKAAEATIKDAEELADALEAIEAQSRQQEEAATKQSIDKKTGYASDGINAIQGLSDLAFAIESNKKNMSAAEEEALAKKKFKINKALQLGGAIINGFKSITTSLSESPVAIGPIPNPAGIASLAFAGISAAASIGKIAASQYTPSGGGGGAASVAAPRATIPSNPPSINTGGGTGAQLYKVGQNAQFAGNTSNSSNSQNSQPVVKAFVVSSDITKTQNKDAVIKRRASL